MSTFTQWSSQETVELISCYDIPLDNALEGGLYDVLKAYLTKTHNVEPFLFINEVKKFNQTEDPRERYEGAKKIIRDFVQPNSPKEINVSSVLRDQVMSVFEQSEASCDKSLFDEMRASVYMELKDDSFPNFLSSNLFVDHVETMLKTDTEYLTQIGSLKVSSPSSPTSPTKRRNTTFSKDNLQINDEDFDVMYQDIKADEILKSKLSTSTVKSRNRHYKRFKSVYEMPLEVEQVFSVMCSNQYYKLEEALKFKSKIVSTFTGNGYYVAATHDIMNCPFPMTPRDYSNVMSCRRLRSCGSIIVVRKSVVNPEVPVNKKYVRANIIQGTLIENTPKGSRIVILSFVDLAGPSLFDELVKRDHRDCKLVQVVVDAHDRMLKAGTTNQDKCFLKDSLKYFESNGG